jgi:hypothetical protein
LRLAAIEPHDQDQEDAVSDEYDSEHAESLMSIERVAARTPGTTSSLDRSDGAVASVDKPPLPPDKRTEAISPSSWSDVKI